MEPHIYHLNRDEITDLDIFLKKKKKNTKTSTKVMQLNYLHLEISKLNIYSSSLLGHLFVAPMLLDDKILLP